MIVVAYGFTLDVFRFQLRIMLIIVLWQWVCTLCLFRQLPSDDNSDGSTNMPDHIDPTPSEPLASDIINSLITGV